MNLLKAELQTSGVFLDENQFSKLYKFQMQFLIVPFQNNKHFVKILMLTSKKSNNQKIKKLSLSVSLKTGRSRSGSIKIVHE
jgi:hypothetical protein